MNKGRDMVFNNLGSTYMAMGQNEKALSHVMQALKINPRNTSARTLANKLQSLKSKSP